MGKVFTLFVVNQISSSQQRLPVTSVPPQFLGSVQTLTLPSSSLVVVNPGACLSQGAQMEQNTVTAAVRIQVVTMVYPTKTPHVRGGAAALVSAVSVSSKAPSAPRYSTGTHPVSSAPL